MARRLLLLGLVALAGCSAPRPRGTVIGAPIVLPACDEAAALAGLAERTARLAAEAEWPTLDAWDRRARPERLVIEPRFPSEPYPRVLAVVHGIHDPALGLAPPSQPGGVPFGAWTPGPPSATGLYAPPHAVGRAPF